MALSLVSIVTPCYNSIKTIEATILSVLGQSYSHIEYIVMDARSTDGTVDLIRKYESRLKLISEPDRGQSDAINKGFRLAQGDILAWLNADDHYFPDTVEQAATFLEKNPDVGWVYGTAVSLDAKGVLFPFRNLSLQWSYDSLLHQGCFIEQPSVFLRRAVIDKFGYLDEKLHYGLDYEYWLRIGREYPGHHLPAVRSFVIRSADTKTESGGVPRLREIEQMVQSYGATEYPQGSRHEWAMGFIESFFKHLWSGEWSSAASDFREIWRYPRTIPRSFSKVLIRKFVPPTLETKLRQVLMSKN